MARKVFRCAVGTRVFAWAVIVGGLVAIAGLVAMLVRGLGSLPVIITLLVLAVFGMVYLWRFALYPRVVADDKLWVINPMHTHILDADEVTDIHAGPNGLVVSHPGGTVEAWAVQKSSGALRKNRTTRADHVAAALLDTLRGAGTEDTGGPTTPVDEPAVDEPAVDEPAVELIGAAGDAAAHEPDRADAHRPDPGSDVDRGDAANELRSDHDVADDSDGAGDAGVSDDDHDRDTDDDADDGDDDDLIIRRAHLDDLATLVALEEEINTAALAHIFGHREPFPVDAVADRWRDFLADRSVKVRVAEVDGEPIGYLCYDADHLHRVGLLAAHSGRGHGRSLLAYAVDDMAARGTSQARLQVLEDNAGAREFYRRLGWVETGESTPCQYPPHPAELTMALDLDDRAS